MPASFTALILLGVVITPGFLAFQITRELGKSGDKTISDWELLFQSMTFASALLAIEVLLISVVGAVAPDLPILAGATGDDIRKQGLAEALSVQPLRTMAIGSLEFLVHLMIIVLVGWADPLGRWLDAERKKRGTSRVDTWVDALVGLRQAKGKNATFVRVRLTSGEFYTGYFSRMSLNDKKDGSRDIILQGPSWSPDMHSAAIPLSVTEPQNTFVGLSTSDVVAIEGFFTDVPRDQTRPSLEGV